MIEVRLTTNDLEQARHAKTRARAFNKAGAIAFAKLEIDEPIQGLQVRARENHDMELVVQDEDDDDATFVLVTGKPPLVQVRGWIKGWQAKTDTWKREGGYMVPHGVLRDMEQLGVRARKAKPKEQRPCTYANHEQYHWRLPDANPYTADPQRWQCGKCHPPPWPNIWEVSAGGIQARRLHIVWREEPDAVPIGPSAPPRSVAAPTRR